MIPTYADIELRVRGLGRFARREHGATAVEYALMVTLIAVVIILAVTTLGSTLSGIFDRAADSLAG